MCSDTLLSRSVAGRLFYTAGPYCNESSVVHQTSELLVELRDGHGLGPSIGWVGLNEKYCGTVAEYCKAHTFHWP